MSPELELLDQLGGTDERLLLALQIFGWPEETQAMERARYSVLQQIKEGLILLKERGSKSERILPDWEIKQVLAEDRNWIETSDNREYYLSLTERGGSYLFG